MLKSILLVGLGSCAGGILRYLLSLAVHPARTGFPLATFLTNITGCLIIGILFGVFSRNSSESSSLCLLLTTGFCGGFTTFSTFSNDALTLLQNGNTGTFAMYVAGSLLFGILATFGGYAVVRLF